MARATSTVHSPYLIPPEVPQPAVLPPPSGPPPVLSQRPFSRTRAVLAEIVAAGGGWADSSQFGWEVLNKLWGIQPSSFDHPVLLKLAAQSTHMQQHLLLMVATMDVRKVKNPSALLNTLISECGATTPVCLAHLGGHCRTDACEFLHPTEAPGWLTLRQKWQLGWLDFDYAVLNTLLRKPAEVQDQLLCRFSRMRLRSIHNLSALLYSVVAQSEKQPPTGQPDESPLSPTSSSLADPTPGADRIEFLDAGCSEIAESLGNSSCDQSRRVSVNDSEAGTPGAPHDLSDADFNTAPLFCGTPSPPRALATEPPAPAPQVPVICLPSAPSEAPVLFQPRALSPASGASTRSLSPSPLSPSSAPETGPAERPPVPGSCGTERVLRALQSHSAPAPRAGWQVLHYLWGIGPFNFAPQALRALRKQHPCVQEHILLSIAAMDLHRPHDLTDLLQAALNHSQLPVCWRYLAGLCPGDVACRFPHPPFLPPWDSLGARGVSYLDVDYPVLNVFFALPPAAQERILSELACCPALGPNSVSGLMLRLVERNCGR